MTDQQAYFYRNVVRMINDITNISLRAFVSLQLNNGLRVSDVLNISYSDITPRGQILVRQGKGSISKVVSDFQYIDFYLDCKQRKLNPFSDYNRFFIYRLYKKYDIYQKNKGQKNASITHAPRKILAQSLQNDGFTLDEIRVALGHNSKRSTEYYIDKKLSLASYRRRREENKSSLLHPVQILKNGSIRIDPRANFSNKQEKDYFKQTE